MLALMTYCACPLASAQYSNESERAYLGVNTAAIFKLAGSITARSGCPLPVRGMVSG